MGNFHCISSGCGRVVYREYLPPVVRWRYEDEDWNEIEADDYKLEKEVGKCPSVEYHVFGVYLSKNINNCDKEAYWHNNYPLKGEEVISYQPVIHAGRWQIPLTEGRYMTIRPIAKYWYDRRTYVGRATPIGYAPEDKPCRNDTGYVAGYNTELVDVVRADGQPDNCGGCKLTIALNGQTVHEETRDTCPDVEKLPCRLSEKRKEIKILKKPWVEGIEVINFARGISILRNGLPISFSSEIPKHCLNIYNTNVSGSIIPLPNIYLEFDHIDQICSVPACPPPEYQVICDCDCRECPPNTCAVACDGYICCYDTSTGFSVESIPSAEYCGEVE